MTISLPFRYLGLPSPTTRAKALDAENKNIISSIDIFNTLDSIDRISALPDSIRGVILSFLPTKNAVATSTLSKTWKFLWRTVHTLDFCLDVRYRSDFTFEQSEDERKKFVGFVNRVLLHHDAGVLNKFCLEWTEYIQSHATSWVKTAITRNVHELSLTLGSYYSTPFDIKSVSVFSCDSLRSLHFNGRICLSAATVFCLPRLETLDLEGVTFESDETFVKMIRGCPVLNYLRVCMIDVDTDYFRRDTHDTDDFKFVISSTSLRRLELYLGPPRYKYLKLEASSLEHLMIYGCKSVNFAPKKLSSFVEANLRICLDDDDFSQADICNAVVDAVSALDCAKILTLSEDVMRVLSCATINLSTNLKRLVKLETTAYCCHWSSLLDLVQSSNNLEVLTINQDEKYVENENDHDHSNWTTPVEVPRCLSNNLKKVVVNWYNGYEDEREMIRYMLKHGSVLEDMQILCHRDKRREIELIEEICEFPRKSPACEVEFFGWKLRVASVKHCNDNYTVEVCF